MAAASCSCLATWASAGAACHITLPSPARAGTGTAEVEAAEAEAAEAEAAEAEAAEAEAAKTLSRVAGMGEKRAGHSSIASTSEGG